MSHRRRASPIARIALSIYAMYRLPADRDIRVARPQDDSVSGGILLYGVFDTEARTRRTGKLRHNPSSVEQKRIGMPRDGQRPRPDVPSVSSLSSNWAVPRAPAREARHLARDGCVWGSTPPRPHAVHEYPRRLPTSHAGVPA